MMKKAGDCMTFGDRLVYARKKKGLTQKQLAELSGVSESAISDYELGNKSPRPAKILKIVKVLEVSEDWLMGNDADYSMEKLTENPKNTKLTKEQQRLVADSESLIKAAFRKFARFHNLDGMTYEDIYGDAAIALCKATETYDETRSSFSLYAYCSVNAAMGHLFWKNTLYYHCNNPDNGTHMKLESLNKKIRMDDGDDKELESIISGPDDEWESLEYKILVESIFQKVEPILSSREKEVFHYWLHGFKNCEIAKAMGVSRMTIGQFIFRVKNKCRASFNPEEIFS